VSQQHHADDERLEDLLADVLQLPLAAIHDDLAMREVEAWDSLKHMELIVSLETAFGLEFNLDEILAMTTVQTIKRVLLEKGAAL
jgi:acyl carrier protein